MEGYEEKASAKWIGGQPLHVGEIFHLVAEALGEIEGARPATLKAKGKDNLPDEEYNLFVEIASDGSPIPNYDIDSLPPGRYIITTAVDKELEKDPTRDSSAKLKLAQQTRKAA